MSKLTQVQTKAYIASGGTVCPFCGADQLEGDGFDIDNGHVYQEVTCTHCDAEWRDCYRLYRIEQDPEPEPIRMTEED
jgi:hypothetical protein